MKNCIFKSWLAGVIIVAITGCRENKIAPTERSTDIEIVNPESVTNVNIAFEDLSQQSGVNHTTRSGFEANNYGMVEFVGGGVAVFDYDLDGLCDIVLSGGGGFVTDQQMFGINGQLYRASTAFQFTDCTLATGLEISRFYNHAVLSDDFNADGFDDLAVSGFGGVQLLMNNGDGTFSRAVQDLDQGQWSVGLGAADFNNDGLSDLYVAHYLDWSLENNPVCPSSFLKGGRAACNPTVFVGISDQLFIQDSSGEFISKKDQYKLLEFGRGLGVICGDINSDGLCDVYVANDIQKNFYYINSNGTTFQEAGIHTGSATDDKGVGQGSMGIAIGDYQNDSQPDLFVTNFALELSALYSGRGRFGFRFVTSQVGIPMLGPKQISWGTSFTDFDLDGDEDLMVSSGHVDRESVEHLQMASLLENVGGSFRDVANKAGSYFEKPWPGRGLATFDADLDGRMDVVLSHLDEPSHVLRNTTSTDGKYIEIRLIGRQCNRNAVGATVTLRYGDQTQMRLVTSGGSYLSQSERLLCFGCSKAAATLPLELEIRWPAEESEKIQIDRWDQSLAVVQGNSDHPTTTFSITP